MSAFSEHSEACVSARGGSDRWPRLGDFRRSERADGPEALAAVLACASPAHDTARAFLAGAGTRWLEA